MILVCPTAHTLLNTTDPNGISAIMIKNTIKTELTEGTTPLVWPWWSLC